MRRWINLRRDRETRHRYASSSDAGYGYMNKVVSSRSKSCDILAGFGWYTQEVTGMGGSHRGIPRGSLRLLSLLAATGLALASAPAQASPLTPPAPRDAQTAAAQVGPEIVDIDAKLGFQSAIGAGTGIVIDPSVVLTNNHVIAGATDLTARSIANGQTYGATVIGFDRQHDIAVLQLSGGGLPVANIGTSDTVKVGDPVVSLGNAGGAGGAPSVEEGRIGALNQTVSANDALT